MLQALAVPVGEQRQAKVAAEVLVLPAESSRVVNADSVGWWRLVPLNQDQWAFQQQEQRRRRQLSKEGSSSSPVADHDGEQAVQRGVVHGHAADGCVARAHHLHFWWQCMGMFTSV